MKIITNFVILSIFISFSEAKVKIDVKIYDYSNHYNLMHNGKKCESFHWAGDHCDPMFIICVYGAYECDLKYATTRFWANNRYVWDIYSGTIFSDKFLTSIKIKVTADDHDRYDAHDHIGVFRANFYPQSRRFDSWIQMQYGPSNLNINLKARVKIQCADNYYGQFCDKYCYPSNNYRCSYFGNKICFKNYYGPYCNNYCVPNRIYACNPVTGEKTCKLNCGAFGKCENYIHSMIFYCKCFGNWTGRYCQISPSFIHQDQRKTTTYLPLTSKELTTYTTTMLQTTKLTSPLISTPKVQFFISTSASTSIDSTLALSSLLTTKRVIFESSTKRVEDNKISSDSQTTFYRARDKSTTSFNNDKTNIYMYKSSTKSSNVVLPENRIQLGNQGKNERLRASSKLSKKSSEGNSIKFEISIYQIIYGLAITLLICIVLFLLAKLWKAKYKMKYLLSNSSRPLPQVIFTPKAIDINSLQFNGNGNTNFHMGADSVYDSCTLTTNLNDEVVYEEPISKSYI